MRKKDLLIILAAICAAAALVISQLRPSGIPTGAWGLHFQQAGQPPVAPAGSAQLAQYDSAYLGDPTQPVLYLTFDAGYENGHTAQILDVLQKHQVPAAFFLVGSYLEKNQDLVRRMVSEGHIVGNHTMHHPDMAKLTDADAFRRELTELEDLYKQITGQEMEKFYRPPQGVYTEDQLKLAQEMGYRTVFWSLAYADWRNDSQPTAQQAFDKLLPRTHNGAVVLLHATSATNAQILDELLTKWKALGYTFAPLTELI